MLQSIFDWWRETLQGMWNLRFRRSEPKYHPLPETVKRTFIKTAENEPLELLVCEPQRPKRGAKPVLFLHGGFGHASVWLNWITYLHTKGYGGTLYATSVRGHGASYSPSSWFRMVWRTKHDDIARDLVAAIRAVTEREATEPILIGHSAGGEMCQYVLSQGMARTPALGLIGTVPHFGIATILANWYILDRWIYVRGLFYLLHPKGHLATTRMVQRAFFGPDQPIEATREFERWAADYESMGWPMESMGENKNGRPEWLDVRDIVRGIANDNASADKVLVLVGTEDKLMEGATKTTKRVVEDYTAAIAEEGAAGGRKQKSATGVRLVEIQRAGHHVQNDIQWEEGADALLQFLRQV